MQPANDKVGNLNLIVRGINCFKNFFSLYEKIWLSFFVLIGIIVTILTNNNILFLIALIAGLIMELTLAKRSKWCFLFVLINSLCLIIIGIITGLYSEIFINTLFWVPYSIAGFILWNKYRDIEEHKNLTKVKELKWWHTLLIVLGITALSLLWSRVLLALSDVHPVLDAFSTFFQLLTGILILLRFKEQWLFWLGYIIISATIWILLNQWVMLIISFGYLTNSIYGLIKWDKYIKRHQNSHNKVAVEAEKNK
ncbi:MAG: nicotinamide riboside transporter PnuC [Spirochaetales bacterium]